MLTVGVASSSMIVAMPVPLPMKAGPVGLESTTVKVSFGSSMLSSIRLTVTSSVSTPGAKVRISE